MMPKLIIKGFNPLQTSEKPNLILSGENEYLTDKRIEKEYECDLEPGNYNITIISMIYKIKTIEITLKENKVIDLNMEIDPDYHPSNDSDYLKTKGWLQNSCGEWISPKTTIKHFDSFLCARFDEFMVGQAKLMEEDEGLMELNMLRHERPVDFEKAMWIKYREITYEDYNNFVVDSIIDA